MNPTPAKRARRTSSPSSPTESTASTTQVQPRPLSGEVRPRPPTASPSHPILPAPIPSNPAFVPFAPGPSGWQSDWRSQSRRSYDATSPESTSSLKLEGTDEHGVIFTRDISSRAPRSMMACTRCRKQKMKCDGPSQIPCRGCRQSGHPCIFEPRSRPKSISVIPARPPPFHMSGRPGSPASFYPAGPQPAPPITSRAPPLGGETYGFRSAREPMPPPPPTSLAALTSPYPSSRHTPPPSISAVAGPNSSSTSISQPPPSHVAYYNPPPNVIHPPPFPGPSSAAPPVTPNYESRLRTVESAVRPLSALPSAISALHATVSNIQRTLSPRRSVEVSETTWENYRNRAWPLTPWLVGLRESTGVAGLVVSILGKRTIVDRDEGRKKECEALLSDAAREIGRLVSEGGEWMREEMRAAGVLATWINDPTFAALAIAQARVAGVDKLFHPRRNHDDWREWIYLIIMDHLCHIPDYLPPVTRENLSVPWRERLGATPPGDPGVRDRDLKLLMWLEYSEMLADVQQSQQTSRAAMMAAAEGTAEDVTMDDRRGRAIDPWRKHGASFEAWASTWAVRTDPINSLHYNYAILYTASPVFMADKRIWEDLAVSSDGYTLLERGRDAAIGVIQAISSVEIGRTLPYSFALFRPFLALSVLHLVSLPLTVPPSTTPLITSSHLLSILRQAYDAILSHQPLDRHLPPPAGGPASTSLGLLGDLVEGGRVEVGKRWVGMEVGRDGWRRIVG
ncbi:hypothetical protein IAU60_006655 [Kwoniella sp. DSM 27419]